MIDIDNWYRQYGESVHRRCLRLTRDRAQALDLMQEVFLRVHKYKDSYRGEASPLSWLYTITNRCFFDSLRKNKLLAVEEIEAFIDDKKPQNTEEQYLQQDLVVRLLKKAPKDVRNIVIYRFFDELDYEQIAEKFNINEKTVRRKLAKFYQYAKKYCKRS
jgi:RNA polymerase sigma-70 factor (ECF subfamily)